MWTVPKFTGPTRIFTPMTMWHDSYGSVPSHHPSRPWTVSSTPKWLLSRAIVLGPVSTDVRDGTPASMETVRGRETDGRVSGHRWLLILLVLGSLVSRDSLRRSPSFYRFLPKERFGKNNDGGVREGRVGELTVGIYELPMYHFNKMVWRMGLT